MNKKAAPKKDLRSSLETLATALRYCADQESRFALLKTLDEVSDGLQRIRRTLEDPELIERFEFVGPALQQVIAFIDSTRHDEKLATLMGLAMVADTKRRRIIDIPANLSIPQIRELLNEELSLGELRAVAAQRSISVHKASRGELKRQILENLSRQEGYQKLAEPRESITSGER
jgi:hypothetical protein